MRINCIPVNILSDNHLRAEFREIIMSIHYYKRSIKSHKGINEDKISERYTLNAGHAYMWYNKFGYILKRYYKLLDEMRERNYKTSEIENKFSELFNKLIPFEIRNDWKPTKEDMIVNLKRILLRIYEMEVIKNKPNFYKYYGMNLSFLEYSIMYSEMLDINNDNMFNIIKEIENKFKKEEK
jgi:hypothetical protein